LDKKFSVLWSFECGAGRKGMASLRAGRAVPAEEVWGEAEMDGGGGREAAWCAASMDACQSSSEAEADFVEFIPCIAAVAQRFKSCSSQ
jgi:hypothetical protein